MKYNMTLARTIVALRGHRGDISDVDVIAFLKYNPFKVLNEDNTVLFTNEQILKELEVTEERPITVGDTVLVDVDEESLHEGKVREVKFQVTGLGNKYYGYDKLKKK